MQAKGVKITISQQINQVFDLYNQFFGQPGHVAVAPEQLNLGNSLVGEVLPEDNGWINWLRGKFGAEKDREILVQSLDYSDALQQCPPQEATIDPLYYNQLRSFLVEYDAQKKGRNFWLFQGSNNYDEDTIKDHRYLITALLMRKINSIFQLKDINTRINQLNALRGFIAKLLEHDNLTESSSNDVRTMSLKTTLRSLYKKTGEIVNDNQVLVQRSEKLRSNLQRLSVETTLNQINGHLLHSLSVGKQEQNLPGDFIEKVSAIPSLAEMSHKEFLRRRTVGISPASDYIMLTSVYADPLKDENYFNFIQKYFLQPAQVPALLKGYHAAQTAIEKEQILAKLNEFTVKVEPQELVAFGIYGLLTDSTKSNQERFNSLGQNEQLSLEILANLFNRRNELAKISYYVRYIKDIVVQAGNLAKFFAQDQMVFIFSQLQDTLVRMQEDLRYFDTALTTSLIEFNPVLLANGMVNHNLNNRRYLQLNETLESTNKCLSELRDCIKPSSLREDLAHLRSTLEILTAGAVNILGMPVSRAENKVVPRAAHLAVLETMERQTEEVKQAQEKNQSLLHDFQVIKGEQGSQGERIFELENEVAALKQSKEPLEKRSQELEAELKKEKQYFASAKPVIDAVVALRVDSNGRANANRGQALVDLINTRLTKKKIDPKDFAAYQNLSTVLSNLRLCLNRLKDYELGYKHYVENTWFSFFHGKSGVTRAEDHSSRWLAQQDDLMAYFYSKLIEAENGDGLNSVTLKNLYVETLEQINSKVSSEIKNLNGGGTRVHSYKTYLLAYKLDLQDKIAQSRGAAPIKPMQFDVELNRHTRLIQNPNYFEMYRSAGINFEQLEPERNGHQMESL